MGDFSLKSKKGTAMVEAAVVLPLIILVLIGIIYILTFISHEALTNTKIHIELNRAMGEETKTVHSYKKIKSRVNISQGKHLFLNCYFGESNLKFNKTGILQKSFIKQLENRTYEVNERKFIRYTDFFKE